ncbi:MAG TPA: tetratricopeptide repeat protein [Armatimonadota bacterium]|jgi:tetratricopeptide (TPR) repeat protein
MTELLQEAHNHRLGGQYPEAEACYRQVLEADANCAEACWGLGHTLLGLGDFDGCTEFFQHAIDLEPTNALFILDLAKFLTMLGEYEQARPLFNQVIEMGANERFVSEAKKQLAYF